jgi:hypothetical protein
MGRALVNATSALVWPRICRNTQALLFARIVCSLLRVQYEFFIIADEVYHLLSWDAEVPPPMRSFDGSRVILNFYLCPSYFRLFANLRHVLFIIYLFLKKYYALHMKTHEILVLCLLKVVPDRTVLLIFIFFFIFFFLPDINGPCESRTDFDGEDKALVAGTAPAFRIVPQSGCVVVSVSSMAKILTPAMRIGWVEAAPCVLERMVARAWVVRYYRLG